MTSGALSTAAGQWRSRKRRRGLMRDNGITVVSAASLKNTRTVDAREYAVARSSSRRSRHGCSWHQPDGSVILTNREALKRNVRSEPSSSAAPIGVGSDTSGRLRRRGYHRGLETIVLEDPGCRRPRAQLKGAASRAW
jgi:hypothetical protein